MRLEGSVCMDSCDSNGQHDRGVYTWVPVFLHDRGLRYC